MAVVNVIHPEELQLTPIIQRLTDALSATAKESETPFILDARRNPDDWMPLLLFSDWLETRHDPRSQLIRLLKKIDNPPPNYRPPLHSEPFRPEHRKRTELLREKRRLLEALGEPWSNWLFVTKQELLVVQSSGSYFYNEFENELRDELRPATQEDLYEAVVLDFTDLRFASALTHGLIVATSRRLRESRRRLAVAAGKMMWEQFRILRLNTIITTRDSVEDACSAALEDDFDIV